MIFELAITTQTIVMKNTSSTSNLGVFAQRHQATGCLLQNTSSSY